MSPLKDSIDKATDPSLTEDNFQYNFDVVDLVNDDPDTNIEEAMDIIKIKLKSSDANVVLRTTSLIDTLAENCGAMMRAEIAKKSFVQQYLLKAVENSRSETLKYAVIKEIYKLSQSFKDDGSLKGLSITFESLQSSYPYLCEQAKNEVNGVSSRRLGNSNIDEDEELKKAIEESLKENQRLPGYVPPEQQSQSIKQENTYNSVTSSQPQPQENVEGSTTALFKVIALYDLNRDDTLSFKTGDIITVINVINDEWYTGCLKGNIGEVPSNYVKKAPEVTSQEITDLKTKLQKSYQVESLLSDLSKLNQDLKSRPNVDSNVIDAALNELNIYNRMEEAKGMEDDLKKLLDLTKIRLQELQNMNESINISKKRYAEIKEEMSNRNFNGPSSNITSQLQNMNINGNYF